MNIKTRIQHLSSLGETLNVLSKNIHANKYKQAIQKAQANNSWFTNESISFSLSEISGFLLEKNLQKWISKYSISEEPVNKTIGIIMAGNIPLVGFHDLLCVLISGNKALVKLSSKDQHLYQMILDILIELDVEFKNLIRFTDVNLKSIDAIIATGSNNSARYFEHYFSKYPNIIRKNRNSMAIISGNESTEDFENLGKDIFTYFGLGCRNVSFLMVPEAYDFFNFLKALEKYSEVVNHSKYGNNYDYQRAILLMNNIHLYDNGSIILKQDTSTTSPIGVIHYMQYADPKQVSEFVMQHNESIQCVVSKTKWEFPTYCFGAAQKPELWDYADNIDTLQFLIDLK
ncbi:MAG: acyl-CoA reductase [Salinivirgaceae bacterium]|nr:acyl-CoA reductase [Salinivirgaceae bacterium]